MLYSAITYTMWFVPVTINLLWTFCSAFSKETTLSFTSPVNPVEANGVVGLHCQVWNFKDGLEELSILKGTTRLSLGESVMAEGENTFVAKRQLGDGSLVYFLSIIGVTRETAGDYKCRVTNIESAQIVTSDSVTLDVMYFPGETDPICSSNIKSLTIDEGNEIRLDCSSEIAVPSVDIKWKRPGKSDIIFEADRKDIHDGRMSSILTLRPKVTDSGNVYICEVTSRAFPKKLQTCHIGPITVRSNSNANIKFTEISTDSPEYGPKQVGIMATSTAISHINSDYICSDICASATFSSQKIYWILATAGATILALIFFVLVMTLCIKYHHLEEVNQASYSYPRYPEKIYSEVESRRVDDRLYMSLVKLKQQNDGPCLQDVTGDGRYHSPTTVEMK